MRQTKGRAVFVVPAFELEKGISIPKTKSELVDLYAQNLSRQIRASFNLLYLLTINRFF